jgi:hypothetical protein
MKPLKIQNCMSSTECKTKEQESEVSKCYAKQKKLRPMASFLNLGFMESF